MRDYDYSQLEQEVEKRIAEKMLNSGQVSVEEYKAVIEQQTLSKLKKEEWKSEAEAHSARAAHERALVDRATKKVKWAEYWMTYSVCLIILFIFGFFVIAHALAVN